MPECRETLTGQQQGQDFVANTRREDREVVRFHIDRTAKEKDQHPSDSRAYEGHTYELRSTSSVLRGQSGKNKTTGAVNQTPVFPPQYKPEDGTDVPISEHGLVLEEFVKDLRNIVIRFNDRNNRPLWVQLQLLKHTNLQIYTLKEWRDSIEKVNRQDRGFKVGFAIELKTHVVSFNSQDMLIQLYWGRSRTELPSQHPHPVDDFELFLKGVVNFIEERKAGKFTGESDDFDDDDLEEDQQDTGKRKKRKKHLPQHRNLPAVTVVRLSGVFPGTGVYTVSELFYLAGIPLNITEAELFDSPSRTARLCAAMHDYLATEGDKIWAAVKRQMHGWVIAVSTEDRLNYEPFLSVYGKQRVALTPRQRELQKAYEEFISRKDSETADDAFWLREFDSESNEDGLYDPFEPECLQQALKRTSSNLGGLIFGQEKWTALVHDADLPLACINSRSPLSDYYAKITGPKPSWLNLRAYTTLFPTCKTAASDSDDNHTNTKPHAPATNPRMHRRNKPWVKSQVYRINRADIWSAWSLLSPKSRASSMAKAKNAPSSKYKRYTDSERQALLFKTVTQQTGKFAIGPLDYCGIAHRIRTSQGHDIIAVCRYDPAVDEFWMYRLMCRLLTRRAKKKSEDDTKVLDTSDLKKIKVKISTIRKAASVSWPPAQSNHGADALRVSWRKRHRKGARKRRRSSAQLSATSSDMDSEPAREKRRYKRNRSSADQDLGRDYPNAVGQPTFTGGALGGWRFRSRPSLLASVPIQVASGGSQHHQPQTHANSQTSPSGLGANLDKDVASVDEDCDEDCESLSTADDSDAPPPSVIDPELQDSDLETGIEPDEDWAPPRQAAKQYVVDSTSDNTDENDDDEGLLINYMDDYEQNNRHYQPLHALSICEAEQSSSSESEGLTESEGSDGSLSGSVYSEGSQSSSDSEDSYEYYDASDDD